MSTVKAITSLDEWKEIVNSSHPVVIQFWATWSGPSKTIKPVFEKFSDEAAYEAVGFYKVDVDDQPAVAEDVGIRTMPAFVLYKDGEKVETVTGANPTNVQGLITKAASLV
ncbi:thioredoxin family protein [Streptomyces sp. DK15]|uniref:thioredoxin family protein n=1 Tax=Streptomyces sp. DK15 TaxID=2957499 RepID=UPI0029B0FB75|nr:thioredoxin family protein [Streptomyces sp. DK15]MDX2395194.1 thioredoxin family protein [Streptomyces sp. DK15]